HGFLIDLLVAGTTRCLRHATLRRHDLVVVRPMAGSTRHLWRRKLHARVLDSSLAHRAGFELRHDCRVESAMALRTRSLSEHAMRNISAQPRWRWGHRCQVGMNQLRVRVANDPSVKWWHDPTRVAELFDECRDTELRVRQRRTDSTATTRTMTPHAAFRDIQLSARVGRLCSAYRRTHEQESGDKPHKHGLHLSARRP